MARIIEYIFPASNDSDVCRLQNSDDDGNFILNGNFANITNSEVSFIAEGYSRNISISSNADISHFHFTITGYQNGQKVSEIIDGPVAFATVYGVEIYDIIVSVVADDVLAVGASIGTGPKGFFRVNIDLNNYQTGNSLLSLIANTVPSISTAVYGTPVNIDKTESTYLELLETHIFNTIKANEADNNYFNSNNLAPYRSLIIQLNGDDTTINSSMYMIFIQATQFQG